MTKHRAHKQTVRAAQAAAGTNYTTALRAHTTGSPAEAPPATLTLGVAPDGRTVPLALADPSVGPVTWLACAIGSGQTVITYTLLVDFLTQHPDGQVIWMDPRGFDPRAYGTTYPDLAAVVDRITMFHDPHDPAALAAFTATPPVPTLAVVSDLPLLADVSVERSEAFLAALDRIATTGRSTGMRLLCVSHQVPNPDLLGASVCNAIGHRIWASRATPLIWERFFGVPEADLPDGALTTPLGHGWLQGGDRSPVPVKFAALPILY